MCLGQVQWVIPHSYIGWICGMVHLHVEGREDRAPSEDFYSLLGIRSVADVTRHGRLRWFGPFYFSGSRTLQLKIALNDWHSPSRELPIQTRIMLCYLQAIEIPTFIAHSSVPWVDTHQTLALYIFLLCDTMCNLVIGMGDSSLNLNTSHS